MRTMCDGEAGWPAVRDHILSLSLPSSGSRRSRCAGGCHTGQGKGVAPISQSGPRAWASTIKIKEIVDPQIIAELKKDRQ